MKSLCSLFTAFFSSLLLAHSLPKSCVDHCHAPFGQLLGQAQKTKAYGNCQDACVTDEWNQVTLTGKKVTTGLKWQCVEYARRWLIENRGFTFADVQYAYHIWELKEAVEVVTNQKHTFQRFENRKTAHFPQVGDLLIYDNSFTVTGHVAVVVGVDEDTILVGEQNYFNRPWDGQGYARRLLVEKNESGYWVLDVGLMGWMRVEKNK